MKRIKPTHSTPAQEEDDQPGTPAGTFSIGQLGRRFGLARSTLLYYDAIGLLRSSRRSDANYRKYTAEDAARLERICMYRQIGLSMAAIRTILDAPRGGVREILEKRLLELGSEIASLGEQQRVIIRMLGTDSLRAPTPILDKESWISLLRAVGLDDEGMANWHRAFEKLSPVLHQEFLEGLGIPRDEIETIRIWSQDR